MIAVATGGPLRPLGLDAVKPMIGDGVGKLVERGLAASGGDPARAGELTPRFLELYDGRAARHTHPYPGAPQALANLKALGLRLGLVTNKPVKATMEIVDALDLARFFGAVVGGDTLEERKPHPAPLLAAAARLGAKPRETVMVGDNHHDVAAARAAGMRAVVVTWGYSQFPRGQLGADALISDFTELLGKLTEPVVNETGRGAIGRANRS